MSVGVPVLRQRSEVQRVRSGARIWLYCSGYQSQLGKDVTSLRIKHLGQVAGIVRRPEGGLDFP